jgi:hypothetical protein
MLYTKTDKEHFKNIIQFLYEDIAIIIESTDPINYSELEDGNYIYFDVDYMKASFVRKETCLNDGYFYNTNESKVSILYTYEWIETEYESYVEFKPQKIKECVKKFDVKSIKNGSNIILIGKRGSGKTEAIIDFLKNQSEEFISNTLIITKDKNLKVKANIIDEFDVNIINEYFKSMYKGAIILESEFENEFSKNKFIENLMINGRHHNKTIMIATHFPLLLKPSIRNNINYIYYFKDTCLHNQKRTSINYCKNITSKFSTFNGFVNGLPDDYSMMVIDRTDVSEDIWNKIMYYKVLNI